MKIVALGFALAALLAGCGQGTSGCRNAVTEYTSSSSNSATVTRTTCSFDKAALTNTCVTTQSNSSTPINSTTTTWPSLTAAVAHAHPFGRNTNTQSTTVTSSCSFSFALTYDSLGRLVSNVGSVTSGTCGTTSITYTAWNSTGRPTVGTVTGVNTSCTGQQVTRTYDDIARTITFTNSGGTGCTSSISQSSYNADGFVVSTVAGSTTTTSTVVSTAPICST